MADSEKSMGCGLRGRLASEWNGAVAEAGMQVSQHSVELKVQLLTGREGVQVGVVSGWLDCQSPPYTDPARFLESEEIKTASFFSLSQCISDQWRKKYLFCDIKCLLGLFTGEWCFHPPCWEQRELLLSTARLAETCSKGTDQHRFVCQCAYLWFPLLLQIYTLEEQNEDMHSRC